MHLRRIENSELKCSKVAQLISAIIPAPYNVASLYLPEYAVGDLFGDILSIAVRSQLAKHDVAMSISLIGERVCLCVPILLPDATQPWRLRTEDVANGQPPTILHQKLGNVQVEKRLKHQS
jgi:hypothetical protein